MQKLEKLIKKHNLSPGEVTLFFKQLKKPKKTLNNHKHYFNEKHMKIGVIPDTHIGSKFFRQDIFDDMLKRFNKEKVDVVYHLGDVIEGMSNREGHIYELDILGTSNQIRLSSDLLSQIKQPFFFITGNHDEWSKKKGNQGILVGDILESKIKNSKFLGEYLANIQLHPNITLKLTHEGNTAYALSYSGQKRINSMQGGTKPNIILNGHLHKSLYMMYRNIHYFESGVIQDQTPFMAMKGSPAMTGFWILDLYMNKRGISRLKPQFHAYY